MIECLIIRKEYIADINDISTIGLYSCWQLLLTQNLKMIKYKIKKTQTSKSGNIFTFNETIKKSELDYHLKNGFVIVKKIIPVITPVSDWWNKFSTGNKIAILAIVVPIIFGGIYFGLEKYSDNKYNSLNQNYDKLKSEQNDLNEQKLTLSDSLNKLNKIIDTISRKPKNKKEFDKKKSD